MGQSTEYTCRSCGYVEVCNTGVGMTFPIVQQEAREEIMACSSPDLEGAAEILREHPNAEVNAENKAYQCRKCRQIFTLVNHSIEENLPKQRHKTWWLYRPLCPKCHITMKQKQPFYCPECGKVMVKSEGMIDWD